MYKENAYRKTYSKEYKLTVVKKRLEEGMSIKSLEKVFGLSNKCITRWTKAYLEHGEAGLEETRGKRSSGRPPKHTTLETENQRLRMENEILKKALSMMRGNARPK